MRRFWLVALALGATAFAPNTHHNQQRRGGPRDATRALSSEADAALRVVLESEAAVLGDSAFVERVRNALYYSTHSSEFWGDGALEPLLARVAAGVRAETTRQPLTVAIDVGANVGSTLGAVASAAGDACTLVAWEPNPRNAASLEESARRLEEASGGAVTVVSRHRAASDRVGTAAFYINDDDEDREFLGNRAGNPFGGLHSFSKQQRESSSVSSAAFEVVIETVDGALEELGLSTAAIGFVKIDVEGHELSVLRGAPRALARTRFVLFEASHLLRRAGTSAAGVWRELDEHGFDVYRVGSKCMLRVNADLYHAVYDDFIFWSNCLAMRKDEPLRDTILQGFTLDDALGGVSADRDGAD